MLLFANDMDVFPICREAFYFMICSFPDQFAPRVRDKSQNCNPQQQQRIEQAFTPVFNFIYNPTKVLRIEDAEFHYSNPDSLGIN